VRQTIPSPRIRKAFSNFKEEDFVYLDPPYAPVNETSFTSYTDKGFDLEKHNELFEKTNKLKKFIMSNACVSLVKESFSGKTIKEIECRRAINSKKPESTCKEVFVSNC
jgi:DNA adenine methylase